MKGLTELRCNFDNLDAILELCHSRQNTSIWLFLYDRAFKKCRNTFPFRVGDEIWSRVELTRVEHDDFICLKLIGISEDIAKRIVARVVIAVDVDSFFDEKLDDVSQIFFGIFFAQNV